MIRITAKNGFQTTSTVIAAMALRANATRFADETRRYYTTVAKDEPVYCIVGQTPYMGTLELAWEDRA